MTQQSVYNYLKKHPNEEFSAKELNEILGFRCARDNLHKMFKHGEVKRKMIKIGNHKGYVYFL